MKIKRLFLYLSLYVSISTLLASCARSTIVENGSLSSYQGMVAQNSLLTKSKQIIDREAIITSSNIKIIPTTTKLSNNNSKLTAKQLNLITSNIDRVLCQKLSNRYKVVLNDDEADLILKISITQLTPSNGAVAGVSKIASFASPVPVPRVPIGLGSLSVEAEAVNSSGKQVAGLVWAKGADIITSKSRTSSIGDAYDLGSDFANDFSKMLLFAKNPFKIGVSLPTRKDMAYSLTGKASQANCEQFGRGSGVPGIIGGALGLPPSWTEK